MSACFLFGAGPFDSLTVTPGPDDWIVAADGGYRHCRACGLTPHLLLGDLDSLDLPLPEDVEVRAFPPEKDDTDTMLALKTGLELGYRVFHLYGCAGGRPDHTLASLQSLAFLAQNGARGYLYGEGYVFTALWNGDLTLPARDTGVFSVFCLGQDAQGVTIRGGQYPLENGTLSPFFPLGVSNQFQGGPVEVSVKTGCLLVGWEQE